MKRLIISCILVLALTNQAFAMGMFGGGGGGGSSSVASSSGGGKSSTSGNSSNYSGLNNTTGSGSGSNTGTSQMATDQVNLQGAIATPELTSLFLLGSAMLGLLGLRKKIKK